MKIKDKISDIKTTLIKSTFTDGILEIGIGCLLLILAFTMWPLPGLLFPLILLTLLVVDKVRDIKTKPYIGYYKLKTKRTTKEILTYLLILTLSLPLLFVVAINFQGKDLREGFKEPFNGYDCTVSSNCKLISSIDLSSFGIIIPFISAVTLVAIFTSLTYFAYSKTQMKRLQNLGHYSLLIGIVLILLQLIHPPIAVGQSYFVLLGIGLIVCGTVGYKGFTETVKGNLSLNKN